MNKNMASKARAPDISEQEASVAYFDLALNGLLLNEIEDCFDGILKDILSCLDGARPASHLSPTTSLLEHVCAAALASHPPSCWLRWLAAVLASLERLLVTLLAALDEPREAEPELLDPALRLESLVDARLDDVRRRQEELGRQVTSPTTAEASAEAEVDSPDDGEATSAIEMEKASLSVGREQPDAAGRSRTEPPQSTPLSPLSSPLSAPSLSSSRLPTSPMSPTSPSSAVDEGRRVRPSRSAGRVVRAALECRLRLLESGRLTSDTNSPPPPPAPEGWASRLGARWTPVYGLVIRWALTSLESGRPEEADIVLSATGLRPAEALHSLLLTAEEAPRRQLLVSRLEHLGQLPRREQRLLRMLRLLDRYSPSDREPSGSSGGWPRRPDLDRLLASRPPLTLGRLLKMSPLQRRQVAVHLALNTDDAGLVRQASRYPADVWRYLLVAGSLLWLTDWLQAAGSETVDGGDGEEDEGGKENEDTREDTENRIGKTEVARDKTKTGRDNGNSRERNTEDGKGEADVETKKTKRGKIYKADDKKEEANVAEGKTEIGKTNAKAKDGDDKAELDKDKEEAVRSTKATEDRRNEKEDREESGGEDPDADDTNITDADGSRIDSVVESPVHGAASLLTAAGYGVSSAPASHATPPSWILQLQPPQDAADITERYVGGGGVREMVLDELASRGRYSTACLASPSLLCRRVLRAGRPPPPSVRRAGLRLLSTAAASQPELQPALLAWLRKFPPTEAELGQLPEELRKPGSPLHRVRALLAVEGDANGGGGGVGGGGVVGGGIGGSGGSRDAKATDPRNGDCGNGGGSSNGGGNSNASDTTSNGASGSGAALSELLEAEAVYQAGRGGQTPDTWLSDRPWYLLGAALAAGRPLPPLADLLWPSARDEQESLWPELRRLLVVGAGDDGAGEGTDKEAPFPVVENEEAPTPSPDTAEKSSPIAGKIAENAEAIRHGEETAETFIPAAENAEAPIPAAENVGTTTLNVTETVKASPSPAAAEDAKPSRHDAENAETPSLSELLDGRAPARLLGLLRSLQLNPSNAPLPSGAPIAPSGSSEEQPTASSDQNTSGGRTDGQGPARPPAYRGFLRQGRPLFAVCHLLARHGETAGGRDGISIRLACDWAAALALREISSTDEDCCVCRNEGPCRQEEDGPGTNCRQEDPGEEHEDRENNEEREDIEQRDGREDISSGEDCEGLEKREDCDEREDHGREDRQDREDGAEEEREEREEDCECRRRRRAVAAGCVVFQHLLGHDVSLLRAQLAAVADVPRALRADITRRLLLGDARAAASLLAHHERRLMAALPTAGDGTTTSSPDDRGHHRPADRWQQRAAEFGRWRHALTLATRMRLPLPERYLGMLAAEDEWMAFLLFAQIYRYPRDQVLRLSSGFSRASLRELVGTSLRCLRLARPAGKSARRRVTSDTERERSAASAASAETSASSSPPTGTTKGDAGTTAATAAGMTASGTMMTMSQLKEAAVTMMPVAEPKDAMAQSVVAALVAAAGDPCPGRALLDAARHMALPALAALAADCQDVSAGDCVCGWLEASLSVPPPTAEETVGARLRRLAALAVRRRRLGSLDTALAVFFPDCALRLAVSLLESLVTLEEPHLSADRMSALADALRATTPQQDSEQFVRDRTWLFSTVFNMLLTALTELLTCAGRARLLGLMMDVRLAELLVPEPEDRPDLRLLLRLSTALGASAVRLDWTTVLPPSGGGAQLRLEAGRAVAALCSAGSKDSAERLALAAGVPLDVVVLSQVTSDLRDVSDEDRPAFWRQCSGRFTDKQLTPAEAVSFFRRHADSALTAAERYVCLKLAWDWLGADLRDHPDCDVAALERGVWTAYTWACINGETVDEPDAESSPTTPRQPLLHQRPSPVTGARPTLTAAQRTAVRAVLGRLVDDGRVRQALLVAECFGTSIPDLERMSRLLQLAERVGQPTPPAGASPESDGSPTEPCHAATAAAATGASPTVAIATGAATIASTGCAAEAAVTTTATSTAAAVAAAVSTAATAVVSAARVPVATAAAATAATAGAKGERLYEKEASGARRLSWTVGADSGTDSESKPPSAGETTGAAAGGGSDESGTGRLPIEETVDSNGGVAAADASTDGELAELELDPAVVHPEPYEPAAAAAAAAAADRRPSDASAAGDGGDGGGDDGEENGDNRSRRSVGFCSSLGRSWTHSFFCPTPDGIGPRGGGASELGQLTELVAGLRRGSEIGQRVLSCARAAIDLQTTYQDVVLTREPLLLLGSVLRGYPPGVDRYRLTADLIHGLRLRDSEVTEVILAEVIVQVKAGITELTPLLELCPDPVLLGNRLLDTAEDLASFPEADGYGDDCQVGLLVAAHSAHTSRLNLQGIGDVMRRARQLVRRLLVKEDFRLMVSLLLGLGRYEEMSYVFELLLREDRLERLLTAGVSDHRLGAALRRHLIRHHPHDTARLRLVTGRFGHHAEAAADWRSRAEELVDAVVRAGPDGHLTDTGRERLREAMDCYRHAATFYKHADRLSSAESSLCQARLVALQISISSGALPLPEGARPLLLRRNQQQMQELLTETLPYGAARLVLAAYPERPADWAPLLYRQYLCLGRDQYLTDYLTAEGCLDHVVLAGLLRRVRGSGRQFSTDRLRRLALSAAGPELQYRAASQLQLRDVIGDLLDTAEAGWLRDTVWKTGGM